MRLGLVDLGLILYKYDLCKYDIYVYQANSVWFVWSVSLRCPFGVSSSDCKDRSVVSGAKMRPHLLLIRSSKSFSSIWSRPS